METCFITEQIQEILPILETDEKVTNRHNRKITIASRLNNTVVKRRATVTRHWFGKKCKKKKFVFTALSTDIVGIDEILFCNSK